MVIRKTFSKSFKIEAVRLLGLGEKPASQLAQELESGSATVLLVKLIPAFHATPNHP